MAFTAADRMPPAPPIDWAQVRAYFELTGKLPEEDPEPYIPASFVAVWYARAGTPVGGTAAAEVAALLFAAQSELFASSEISRDVTRPTSRRRRRDGPSAALNEVFKDAEAAATKLAAVLFELRWIMLRFKLSQIDLPELQHFHALLHGVFLQGQWSRLDAIDGRIGTESYAEFLQRGLVGSKVTIGQTWLEDGLQSFAKILASRGPIDLPPIKAPAPYSRAQIRQTFARRVAHLWEDATGRRPTILAGGDYVKKGRSTGFQKFHQQVCGHVAGQLVRMSGNVWSEMTPAQQSALRSRAALLGLYSCSGKTLSQSIR